MGLVEYIHPALDELDYNRISVRLVLIISSVVFYTVVFLLSAFLSSFTRTYRNLTSKEKIFWDLAIVRGVYGIFCIIIGVWSIFIDTELSKDVIFATSPTSFIAILVTIGFFIFECSMVLFSDIYYRQFSVLLNIHHWISLIGYSLIMVVESTHYFGTKGLLLEMSTPFSCLCWTLLKAGKAHTFFWKANQFLLVHVFHLRSVVEFYIWYKTYLNWEQVWSSMPAPMFVCLYTQLLLVTFIRTPYWTYKKTIQMVKPVDWNFEDLDKSRQLNGTVKKNV